MWLTSGNKLRCPGEGVRQETKNMLLGEDEEGTFVPIYRRYRHHDQKRRRAAFVTSLVLGKTWGLRQVCWFVKIKTRSAVLLNWRLR